LFSLLVAGCACGEGRETGHSNIADTFKRWITIPRSVAIVPFAIVIANTL
jgi:hypothetical protein